MLLAVPELDAEPWPTLGPQVVAFIEERAVFGPGSLKGQPAVVDAEKKAIIYRAYEVCPPVHRLAGRRRFQRAAVSLAKGSSKTELLAWIAFCELHPEAPVRFNGWESGGTPRLGRPVADPYIPLVGVTEESTEELAYGALVVMCSEGPDADLFDIGLDRILRLDEYGRRDGIATALAAAPNARDGARTTFQGWDESHRLYLPRAKSAYVTMQANLTKRPLDDPWELSVTTAGHLGQGSIAEDIHNEALAIRRGEYLNPDLMYHHREANPGHDLTKLDERIKAVAEARGGVGEYAPGQFESIARQWDRPKADRAYLARVWLNMWISAEQQAFDVKRWGELGRPGRIPPGELVTVGFDGARFRDSTAFVITDVVTGTQELAAIWQRPLDISDETGWEIPEREVTEAWHAIRARYQVWKMYGDPPHWTETMGTWAGEDPDVVEEWWTNRPRPMAFAIRDYREAIATAGVGWSIDDPMGEEFDAHIGNAGRAPINAWTDDGNQLFILQKIHPDRKFDAGMAAVLSWQARLEALAKGAQKRVLAAPRRIR